MNKTILILGCDGYIGNAVTQRMLSRGFKVIGVDNFLRRQWIKQDMCSYSALPILNITEKIVKFNELGEFYFYAYDVALESGKIEELLSTYRPDTVLNLAHIPSAPYSMRSKESSSKTLMNNILGTNNILWTIKETLPNCHYITIGTTGEYDHYSNIDIEEGYIQIEHKGRKSTEMIYPRRPGSLYHVSKTASTYLIDFVTKAWGLKCTDVQQAVVFGSYTDDIDKTKIYSRLDSDEAGGTAINRFIVQAVLGVPLTIYGEGNHQRGMISLNDSVQALEIAVNNPAQVGKVQVWNQLSEWHSINNLASMVTEVLGKRGIDVKRSHIPTPRNEQTSDHYYNYITEKLRALGYHSTRTIKQEIDYVASKLDLEYIADLKNVVLPKIAWK